MKSDEEYIGFRGTTPEEPKKKPRKVTFDELIKDTHRVNQKIKPVYVFITHVFVAFGLGSVVNYLVVKGFIKPIHVTQIIVFMLSFIYLRLNYKRERK